jgi:hypothetical protein
LAFCAVVILTLGVGPSTVIGQGPIVPDPRIKDRTPDVQELTTDGEYPVGTKFNVRDSPDTAWGPNHLRDCWAKMLLLHFGQIDVILNDTPSDREESREDERRQLEYEKEWARLRLMTPQQEPGESCLTHTQQSEIEVDQLLKVRSAIRNQADALLHSNDPNLMKVGRDLSRLAEQVQPPEAGAPPPQPPPDPLSFWIHGRPAGGAGNPGPGLVFHVGSIPAFQDAGVTLLSNTWSSPRAWPGSVYAERDQPRTVAPAPGLDPAGWPAADSPVLSLSLEEPAP